MSAITIPSKILDTKWSEIIEEEKIDLLINSIEEEIIHSALNEIYEKHIESISFSFVVHCTHLAWLKCFDIIDLKYLPDETRTSIKQFWHSDEELNPVRRDPWTCTPLNFICNNKD